MKEWFYVAFKILGYPINRVIGSGTSLDTALFRFLVSRHCRFDYPQWPAHIIGEHGDRDVPVWYGARSILWGCLLKTTARYVKGAVRQSNRRDFSVGKEAAYEFINCKGYTNFAVALALVRIVSAILRYESIVLPVSSLLDDYYGIKDICLSSPAILNMKGIFKHIPINLGETERHRLPSADGLKGIA